MKIVSKALLSTSIAVASVLMSACSSQDGKASFQNDGNNPVISGVVGKGMALDGTVSIYKSDGTLIGVDTSIIDGKYEVANNDAYAGVVKVVANIRSYRDEVLQQTVDTSDLQLNAVSTVTQTNGIVNVTPVTEIASRIISAQSIEDENTTQIDNINKYTAKTLGLSNYNPTKDALKFIEAGAGTVSNTDENRNAVVLLSISKDTNLSVSDSSTQVDTKVNNTIDTLYQAFLSSVDGNVSVLENIVEDIGDTNVQIDGVANDDIIDSGQTSTDTQVDPTLQTLLKVSNYATNQANTAPTQAELEAIGIENLDSDVFSSVLSEIASKNAVSVDSIAELQTLVDQINSLKSIMSVADDNNATGNITASDYNATGVTDTVDANVPTYNSFIDSTDVNSTDVDTTSERQGLIDGVNAVVSGTPDLNVSLITSLGLEDDINASDANELALFNSIIPAVDGNNTAENIEALAAIAKKLQEIADGSAQAPNGLDEEDLQKLGITGATADNIDGILENLEGEEPITLTDINNTTNAAVVGMTKITDAADANNTTGNVTASDYNATGVTDTVDANVPTYNSFIDSADVNSTDVDTTSELQGLIDGVNAVVSGTPDLNVSLITSLGLEDDINASDANELALFNSIIPAVDGNNSVENIEALAAITEALRDVIDGTIVLSVGNPTDFVNYLAKLGVNPTVSADNINGYLQKLQTDGTVDSLADLNASSQTQVDAIANIAQRADDNNASSTPALAQSDYINTGLTSAESVNVDSYNDFLDSSEINSSNVDTFSELKELTSAVDSLETNQTLSVSELETLDLGNGNDMNTSNTHHVGLLNDVLANDANKTAGHLEALAGAVKLVQDVADGTTSTLPLTAGTTPTRAEMLAALSLLGITNVDDSTLDDFLNSVQGGGAADANTVAKIQSYAKPAPLPANMTITDTNMTKVVVSVYDATPYLPAIDIQGEIDNNTTVAIPYTVVNGSINLAEYTSKSVTVDVANTQNSENNVKLKLYWEAQTLNVGSGSFTAYVIVDDSDGGNDNKYEAKKLDIEDDTNGTIVATFPYATDGSGGAGELHVKIHPGIPDRMFGLADKNGDTDTHSFLYLPVTNRTTGKTWLNNNLGAEYADTTSANFNTTQQATASNDHLAYGSLFQWGRKADGHELINWTDGTTGAGVNGTTSTKSDNPSDALFITQSNWRVTTDDTLWASEGSANNVCPQGYRLPLNPNGALDNDNEFYEESQTWATQDSAGSLGGELKLPMSGYRLNTSGTVKLVGSRGNYWSGSLHGSNARRLNFYSSLVDPNHTAPPGIGFSVRCLKN